MRIAVISPAGFQSCNMDRPGTTPPAGKIRSPPISVIPRMPSTLMATAENSRAWTKVHFSVPPPCRSLNQATSTTPGGYGWNKLIGLLPGNQQYKINQLKKISDTIAIADSVDVAHVGTSYASCSQLAQPSTTGANSLLAIGNRHNDGANVLWLDLRVDWNSRNRILGGMLASGYPISYVDYFFYPKR